MIRRLYAQSHTFPCSDCLPKHLQPPVTLEDPTEPFVRIDVSARVIRSSEKLRSGIPSSPE
jgi:hypothetical protein